MAHLLTVCTAIEDLLRGLPGASEGRQQDRQQRLQLEIVVGCAPRCLADAVLWVVDHCARSASNARRINVHSPPASLQTPVDLLALGGVRHLLVGRAVSLTRGGHILAESAPGFD